MEYLDSIAGHDVLQHAGVGIADDACELEGYVRRVGSIAGSVEIGLASSALQNMNDQPNLQLLTSDGHLSNIKFSDKKIRAGNHVHVEVTGDLPSECAWH